MFCSSRVTRVVLDYCTLVRVILEDKMGEKTIGFGSTNPSLVDSIPEFGIFYYKF